MTTKQMDRQQPFNQQRSNQSTAINTINSNQCLYGSRYGRHQSNQSTYGSTSIQSTAINVYMGRDMDDINDVNHMVDISQSINSNQCLYISINQIKNTTYAHMHDMHTSRYGSCTYAFRFCCFVPRMLARARTFI